MLGEKELMDIAEDYAEQHRSWSCSYQLVYIQKSQFLDGYYDVKYRVVDQNGREIDGALFMEIDEQSGNIITLEELIKIKMRLEESRAQ